MDNPEHELLDLDLMQEASRNIPGMTYSLGKLSTYGCLDGLEKAHVMADVYVDKEILGHLGLRTGHETLPQFSKYTSARTDEVSGIVRLTVAVPVKLNF